MAESKNRESFLDPGCNIKAVPSPDSPSTPLLKVVLLLVMAKLAPLELDDQNHGDKGSVPAQNQPQSSVSKTRNQSQSGGSQMLQVWKFGELGHKSSD